MAHNIDAEALIGTRKLPPDWRFRQLKAREARAYHELVPYPVYGSFKEWKEAERGPTPRRAPGDPPRLLGRTHRPTSRNRVGVGVPEVNEPLAELPQGRAVVIERPSAPAIVDDAL